MILVIFMIAMMYSRIELTLDNIKNKDESKE